MPGELYQGFSSMEAFAAHYFDPRRLVSWEEQVRRINWLHLIERAKEAQRNASSYRNFRVGCAIYAFRTNGIEMRGRWSVFTGRNIKLTDGSRPMCAEQRALAAAESEGYDKIIAMVVIGEPQEDAESGILSKTLHPCGECRKIFQAVPEMSPETLLLTMTPDEHTYEQFSVEQLIALHQRHRP